MTKITIDVPIAFLGEIRVIYDELRHIYEQPSRTYHNLEHINNMKGWLTESEQFAENPQRIKLAIWFHDAVYDPKRSDNELKSAEFWIRKMTSLLPEEPLQWVKLAILATINHYPNADPDIQLLLDLDLASLGASWEIFQENSDQIRQEYIHVPDKDFREGRKLFLQEMLDRSRIYGTNFWYDKLEHHARNNIKRSLGDH